MTYSLTLREEKGSKLTIQEMDGNFLYFQDSILGTQSGVTQDIVIDIYTLHFVNGILISVDVAVPSDIMLKENITLIGESDSGINIYNFNYKGDDSIYHGVIANELIGTQFENAVIFKDNTLRVFYNMIDVEFKKLL